MWTPRAEVTLGMVLMLGAAPACSGNARNDAVIAAPRDDATGTASQASTSAYCLLNAHTDNGTVHFRGPNWLLTSSEGLGPQQLNVLVHQIVQPAMSVSDTFKLDPKTISEAVGYSISERYELVGGARVDVPDFGFQRLEAYTAFQRTVWEIRDASCSVVLGYGASFRPVGVFFQAINTSDLRIPDLDVHFVGPVGVAPGAVAPIPPGTGSFEAEDAGAGNTGAVDGGP